MRAIGLCANYVSAANDFHIHVTYYACGIRGKRLGTIKNNFLFSYFSMVCIVKAALWILRDVLFLVLLFWDYGFDNLHPGVVIRGRGTALPQSEVCPCCSPTPPNKFLVSVTGYLR